MTMLKSIIVAITLLAGSISLAIAQNGPATGGEHPVAGGAAGGPYGYGYGHRHYRHLYGYHRPYHRHHGYRYY